MADFQQPLKFKKNIFVSLLLWHKLLFKTYSWPKLRAKIINITKKLQTSTYRSSVQACNSYASWSTVGTLFFKKSLDFTMSVIFASG